MEYLTANYVATAIVSIFIGASAGYLGSFMILRRMSLVGDALSHVALPGLALALMFNINPFIGAFAFLLAAVVGIWYLEGKTDAPTETLVGIFFTASLALGILLTEELELLESLFGDISKISANDAVIAVLLSLLVIYIARKISQELLLSTVSDDLAMSSGVKTSRVNFIFLLLVATIVALGIKIAGALLTGALVIIPAAGAKNISKNFSSFSLWSSVFGALSGFAGVMLSMFLGYHPGPMIVLTGTAIFIITFLARR